MSSSVSQTNVSPVMNESIEVRGARVHNLKNVDVSLPHDSLVVLTGVSGSGKSSLAFDTVFAEGQRRYLESLSSYQRQFHSQLERPDVDDIDGLPPTISLAQNTTVVPQRSTLATTTDIYDFLRILYARTGTAHCPDCGRAVRHQTPAQITSHIMQLPERSRLMLLAPIVRDRRGFHVDTFQKISKAGFVRCRVDGEVVDADPPPELNRNRNHTIEAVIDRVIVKPGVEDRLKESIGLTLKHGDGTCILSIDEDGQWTDRLFSTSFACPDCQQSFLPVEPRTFSFNSPYGACPDCAGLGEVIDDESAPEVRYTCESCHGTRLSEFSRSVTFCDTSIAELTSRTCEEALEFFETTMKSVDSLDEFDAESTAVINQVGPELTRRLAFLCEVGLDYLSLDRATSTLSGGELQRARLAGCLGSGLLGACYVLDEPTSGLHPRDTQRLIQSLEDLRDQGNTLLVVEHDEQVMHSADWIVDLGPGAGSAGGNIIAQGVAEKLADNPDSITGSFLNSRLNSEWGVQRPEEPDVWIKASGMSLHNLHDLELKIPQARLTGVSGVSGSGKSSAIIQSVVPAVRQILNGTKRGKNLVCKVDGLEPIERLIEIDQAPIGRNARSNPATYSKLWDEIRKAFATTKDSRVRGFTARRFSFNTGDGRCPECDGQGQKRIEMQFMPDVWVPCGICHGRRFNPQTLTVQFKGRSIADVLEMSFREAAEFFSSIPRMSAKLQTFVDVGLGYLRLGQPSTTLSGGEAQRVKLATELGRSGRQPTLYVLDEPTAGLHASDVAKLIDVLQRLVDQGHTVLVVEHNLQVLSTVDWLMDLGPGAGAAGGRLVACGTPKEVADCSESATGAALREHA